MEYQLEGKSPCRRCQGVAQSIFIPSALTIGVHSATSAARERRNFSGSESSCGFDARVDQHSLEGWFGNHRASRLRNLFDDPDRRPGWCEHPNGASHDHAREALLGRRRKLRRSDEPRGTRHGENPQLAGPMEFEHLSGHAWRTHRNLTADQVCDKGPVPRYGTSTMPGVPASDLNNSPVRCWIEPTPACP